MFNLLPGQGLGFSGSKEIAFGLAPVLVSEIPIPVQPPAPPFVYSGGGGSNSFTVPWARVYDNAYSVSADDNEVVELLTIIIGAIDE